MERADVEKRLNRAILAVVAHDAHLLVNDLSERCIAARLAFCLQLEFPDHAVDVEYNRFGDLVKRLRLPDECVRRLNRNADPAAVPDIIVHSRGPRGPNILVLELKKTSNPTRRDCDRVRIHEFRKQLEYKFGALIECETRDGQTPAIRVDEWVGD
jgi:hypothetical protein